MPEVKFTLCEKCGSKRVGSDWIIKHAKGVLKSGEDPRTAPGRRQTIADVKSFHKIFNNGKLPCRSCLVHYQEIISDAISMQEGFDS